MNDRNRGGMTISALLMGGLIASVVVPVICLVVLGFMGPKTTTPFLPVLFLSIVVMVAGFTANILIRRRIQDRLLGLVDVCRNFVGGDRSIRAVVNGDDEFAMLATSLNNLLDSQNFASSAGSPISSVGGSDAAALQAQIEKLLQEVSAVGDGDLRVQAEVTPDTLGVLADSFNYMIEELAKVVGRVQNTAVQVTNASRRVLDRSAELAQASETQVARISQTTKAVEALASFVQDVAHNARLSAEAAQDALRNAKTGQDSVRQSIEGMMLIRENVQETAKKIKRLGERSNEIGEIVRIIEDIADQTNLLALNAAIQSAMAGEHGRGFAVVADEIRLLAERSTESTKRIATLVKSIQGDTYEAVVAMEDSTQEVVKGSQLADEAGQALNSIYSAVERQARTIEMIAQAANEQASVAEDVANAMTEISEITNRTNAGTQEAAMSVSYLSELSDQLRASVSTFRLPERSGESADVFPTMGGMPALPTASESDEQFFQQDMNLNSDWNQNFSADLLSLPQPQENDVAAGGFQFAFNQQEFSSPSGFSSGMPQLPGGPQQSFESSPFGNFAPNPGFPSQPGYGDMGAFDSQKGFDGQPFPAIPQSGYGQPNAPGFPTPGQIPAMPPMPPKNFAPLPGNPPLGRPRWQNPQPQGPGPFGQEQMPFPGSGNGHMGQ
ncbi:MAG TPA: methyl-accepting chemotaxis protein [Ktedonobacteraceae bacterium]|nr:methyl-accepting chemotaxis protein [Ktedonobacteraceae bacterium]